MPRRIRDLALTAAALFVLFAMLISINPRLRERAGQLAGGINGPEWDASGSVLGRTLRPALDIASSYAADNVYLFVFLVAACVLLVLMLRT